MVVIPRETPQPTGTAQFNAAELRVKPYPPAAPLPPEPPAPPR